MTLQTELWQSLSTRKREGAIVRFQQILTTWEARQISPFWPTQTLTRTIWGLMERASMAQLVDLSPEITQSEARLFLQPQWLIQITTLPWCLRSSEALSEVSNEWLQTSTAHKVIQTFWDNHSKSSSKSPLRTPQMPLFIRSRTQLTACHKVYSSINSRWLTTRMLNSKQRLYLKWLESSDRLLLLVWHSWAIQISSRLSKESSTKTSENSLEKWGFKRI